MAKILLYSNDLVLCNFADLFHAQTAAFHTKESWKCKKITIRTLLKHNWELHYISSAVKEYHLSKNICTSFEYHLSKNICTSFDGFCIDVVPSGQTSGHM